MPSMAQLASAIPNAPPAAASTRLSAKNSRSRRIRLAPRAVRTAISELRPSARLSSKFATFAHAINKTNPTAPNSINSVGRTEPTEASNAKLNITPIWKFVAGYCFSRSFAMADIARCACWMLTPGLRRASALKPG